MSGRYDAAADGQTFNGVRCEICQRVQMRGMESADGVVRCQDRYTCDEVAKARGEARSSYDDLVEAGWKPVAPRLVGAPMSEVELTEAEVDTLTEACDGQGEYMCCHRGIRRKTKQPVGGAMLDAVEAIIAARLAAADRDTALRVIAAIEADRDAEVARLGGWEQVHASGMLNNWIGGFTSAITTARAALALDQSPTNGGA